MVSLYFGLMDSQSVLYISTKLRMREANSIFDQEPIKLKMLPSKAGTEKYTCLELTLLFPPTSLL